MSVLRIWVFSLHVHLCTMYLQYPQRPEEDDISPGTRVRAACELTQLLWKSQWAIQPAPSHCVITAKVCSPWRLQAHSTWFLAFAMWARTAPGFSHLDTLGKPLPQFPPRGPSSTSGHLCRCLSTKLKGVISYLATNCTCQNCSAFDSSTNRAENINERTKSREKKKKTWQSVTWKASIHLKTIIKHLTVFFFFEKTPRPREWKDGPVVKGSQLLQWTIACPWALVLDKPSVAPAPGGSHTSGFLWHLHSHEPTHRRVHTHHVFKQILQPRGTNHFSWKTDNIKGERKSEPPLFLVFLFFLSPSDPAHHKERQHG